MQIVSSSFRLSLLSLIHLSVLAAASTGRVCVNAEKSFRGQSIRGGAGKLADTMESTGTADVFYPKNETASIDVVFSDLDGTLIHYPTYVDALLKNKSATDTIILPPSSTGMVGVISSATLRLIRDIRQMSVKFVLVTGMRASTLLKRMPFLPKADAYCCEAGGRIFYPIEPTVGGYTVRPKSFMGSVTSDLDPFSLVEDLEWRNRLAQVDAAGEDGFVGHELSPNPNIGAIPMSQRKGRLWEYAQLLVAKGCVIDTYGYSSCFRLNREQQVSVSDSDSLLNIVSSSLPIGLSTSTNLGCIDIYPSCSGKRNWYVVGESTFTVQRYL
jgi:hypothetical protein